jgi:hypothetical protein
MFENPDKDILNHILGLLATPQNRMSYAEQQRRVCLHQSREIDLRPPTLNGRQRQAAAFDRRHKPLLSRQTLKCSFRSTIIYNVA